MKVIIDRFEGNYAIVELPNQSFANVPKVLFPDAHEGDVINILVDKEETQQRLNHIKNLMDELFEK